MDDQSQTSGLSGVPLQQPQWQANHGPLLPPDFAPLGLILVPNGLRIELTKPDSLVGRHDDADVRLPLPDVSRRHCRFIFLRSRWHILDLNSLNGVLVNNKRVHQAALQHGDRVRIGGFTFQVEFGDAVNAQISGASLRTATELDDLEPDQKQAS